MKTTIMLFALIAFALGLAGCNTIQGMGKDVSATGKAVEKAAEKTKTY